MSVIPTHNRFKAGDILFRQGDPSDHVLRLASGEIEVLREVGAASILLGRAQAGEWLGEMGVIEHRPRSATARANTDGEIEILTGDLFLERVSGDPALARELILRLSVRLRKIEDKIAGDMAGFAHGRAVETASDTLVADQSAITLAAETDVLRNRIGAAAIAAKLPLVVGRAALEDEAKPLRDPDLMIEDDEPFRLSRQHFMIARSGGRFFVSDLGSTLGTIVNGQAIGHNFTKDAAPLRRGENHIVAGGWDSPYAFSVFVD